MNRCPILAHHYDVVAVESNNPDRTRVANNVAFDQLTVGGAEYALDNIDHKTVVDQLVPDVREARRRGRTVGGHDVAKAD